MDESTTMKKPSHAILYALMFGPFFSMFDSGLVNVGLPVIAKDFGTGNGIVQLVKNLGMVIGISFSTPAFSSLMGERPIADAAAYLESARWMYWGAALLSFLGAYIASLRGKLSKA